MSDDVGSMPSLTRSGTPRSSIVRSSASEMTSTALAVSSSIWRSTSTTTDGNKAPLGNGVHSAIGMGNVERLERDQEIRMAVRPLAIIADRLIEGTGRDPVEDAVLVVEDGHISAAGARASVRIPDEVEIVEGDDLTIVPGFIDAHVHIACQSGVDFNRLVM